MTVAFPLLSSSHASRALYSGAVLGALAAVLGVVGDFGASWAWLESPSQRLWLLVRLLGLQVPLGAVAGMAWGGVWHGLGPRVASVLLGLPVGALLGVYLWDGPHMRAVAWRPSGMGLTFVVAALGCFGGMRLVVHALGWARRGKPAVGVLLAGATIGIGFGLSKLDQQVFPYLYEPLHGLLTVSVWGCHGVGLAFLTYGTRKARAFGCWRPTFTTLGVCGSIALFVLNLYTLDTHQTVHVALTHARAGQARSVMLAVSPVLKAMRSTPSSMRVARRADARRASMPQGVPADLPRLPEAHVLLVTIDALRADHLGSHGYPRNVTPAIDRLVDQSMLFERAYAQAPHSSFSLASLMTSAYVHELVEARAPLPTHTLASTLNRAGFHSAGFFTRGIFHTAGDRLDRYATRAFDFSLHEHESLQAEELTDRVLREIDRTVTRGEPPTFLWAHYFDVHEPYRDTSLGTADIDRYDGEIRSVDRALGRLLTEARTRLTRPLIVLLTADHGEEFGDHGGAYHGSSLYDEQIRVPFILHVPGISPGRITTPVELVDMAPTLLGLLDVKVPDSMRGDDLRPFTRDPQWDVGPVFSAVGQKRMVLRWPHKLIADLRFGHFELYDLEHDQPERNNLVDSRPELMRALRGELYAWLDSVTMQAADSSASLHTLERARLGDPRAAVELVTLLTDAAADMTHRTEAARLLGGFHSAEARKALRRSATHSDDELATESVIALGHQHDTQARDALVALLEPGEAPAAQRARCALALAHLRDARAVPGLLDGLRFLAPPDRQTAIRWLGRLRDPSAVDTLIDALGDRHLRISAAIALGQVGGPRAYDALVNALAQVSHRQLRDGIVRALGELGDVRAVPALLPLAAFEPPPANLAESLVRLDAMATGHLGGLDIGPATQALPAVEGIADCSAKPHRRDWHYRHRTACRTISERLGVLLPPAKLYAATSHTAAANGWLTLGIRRVDASDPVTVQVRFGEQTLAQRRIDNHWQDLRWRIPMPSDPAAFTLHAPGPKPRFEVDHVLLVPELSRPREFHP